VAVTVATKSPRSRKPLVVAAVVGIVAVFSVPALFGAGILFHDQCERTTNLGTESLWTPAVIVNSPPNGTATGWANGSALGPLSGNEVSLGNGSAGVLEVRMNWTVYRTGMVWTLGPGFSDPCTVTLSPTAAGVASGSSPTVWCQLQGPGSASDENLSATTPVPGCSFLGTNLSAEFNDSFVVSCASGSAFDGYCGSFSIQSGGGTVWSVRSITGFSIQIPLPGTVPTSWITVRDPVNQTVLYVLPGAGCWIEEQTGIPPGLSSGLLVWGPYAPYHGNAGVNSGCPFE